MLFNNKVTGQPLTFGLAMTAGLGLILMMLALAIGVISGTTVDGRALTVAFVAGLFLLIGGIIGWVIVTEPWKHFDDINQPKDTGHGHGAHDAPGDKQGDTHNEQIAPALAEQNTAALPATTTTSSHAH